MAEVFGPSGGRRRRAAAASRFCWPSGVNGGIRPSGGSMISDVRLSNSRSIISEVVPVAVVLVKRATSPSAARNTASPAGKSALVFVKRRSARRRNSATSSSVSDGLPSSALGRSSGVALLFNQTPCRSGWPSAARGGVQRPAGAIALRFVEPSGGCRAIDTAPPIENARTADHPSHRRGMSPSGHLAQARLTTEPTCSQEMRRFYTWRDRASWIRSRNVGGLRRDPLVGHYVFHGKRSARSGGPAVLALSTP
jgi:hypothetical protein